MKFMYILADFFVKYFFGKSKRGFHVIDMVTSKPAARNF